MTLTEPPAQRECPGCDTCGSAPCQGGCQDYLAATGEDRHGCTDQHACARMWAVNRFARNR